MSEERSDLGSLLGDMSKSVGEFFRHLFPGVIALTCGLLAYPSLAAKASFDLKSPWHLLILAVLATVLGNIWFVLNRYGFCQVVDLALYCAGSPGPSRKHRVGSDTDGRGYLNSLARFVIASCQVDEKFSAVRNHIRFRNSVVSFLYTVGQTAILFAILNEPVSLFGQYWFAVVCFGVVTLAFGFWQDVIGRHIDWYLVDLAIKERGGAA